MGFLLNDKFEVKNVFEIFYVMVETQFNEKLKIFRSDNGREFFNEQLGNFFRNWGSTPKLLFGYTSTKWDRRKKE